MNLDRRQNKVIEKIIGVVVLFIGLAAIVGARYFFLKAQKTQNWPSVEGIITKSGTRSQRGHGANSGVPTTIAEVWYTFVINGVEYRNDTISIGQYGSSDSSHAAKEAHRYPVGRKVMVYYNPENFNDSVLEHKTPWGFIGIFAGLGTILVLIGLVMLSDRFRTNHDAVTTWHTKRERETTRVRKMPTAAVWRMMIFLVITSALIAWLVFNVLNDDKTINRENSKQPDAFLPERYQSQLVSTYSSNETSSPCKEGSVPNVAERQKINLKDGVHTLYVTATLCIDEEEMKTSNRTRRTWLIIANQLATYDRVVFDPQPALLISNGEKTFEEFEFKLKHIEQECLENLHGEDIFFVKAIKFQLLQVFNEN